MGLSPLELHVEYEASQPKQEVPSVQRCPGEATGANVNRHSLSPTASSSPGHPVSGLKVIPAFADMPRMPPGSRRTGCRLLLFPWCPRALGWGHGCRTGGCWLTSGGLQVAAKICQLSVQGLFTSALRQAFDL